ncbi:MAG: Gfo/Idh/MocA family oxidoreductase [Chloroflexi bacterium]|nr:Gfo/Idh/MocA family oxidoreductase [Chloroflexota bacterium]
MRAGMVGLAALYWPVAIGNGLKSSEGVEFLGAATLGESEAAIRGTLGMSPDEYAGKYGVNLYEQAEQMIEEERLDTVVLISRHSEHAVWAERMAQLGVDIFIPKTFATTLEDAERIVNAQKRYGVKIAVGPSARYLPAMRAVKQGVDDGLIGKPFALRICHHHGTIDGFHTEDWYRDPREGGPELSLGWYGIDLILHLMQDQVRRVAAEYGNFTTPDSPFMDCGRITLRMAGGGIGSFDMYFCNRIPYPSWQLEIVGPGGVITIHRIGNGAQDTVVSIENEDGYRQAPLPTGGPHWEIAWVDEFKEGRDPEVSAEVAGLITRLSLAARESARQGCSIAV